MGNAYLFHLLSVHEERKGWAESKHICFINFGGCYSGFLGLFLNIETSCNSQQFAFAGVYPVNSAAAAAATEIVHIRTHREKNITIENKMCIATTRSLVCW